MLDFNFVCVLLFFAKEGDRTKFKFLRDRASKEKRSKGGVVRKSMDMEGGERGKERIGKKKKAYHAKHGSHGGRGKVGPELGSNASAVSVDPSNLSPDDTITGPVDSAQSTVDVGNTFAEVELGLLLGFDIFELEKAGVVPLHALTTLESDEAGTDVKPL